jgi:transcription initiation factor TFIIB
MSNHTFSSDIYGSATFAPQIRSVGRTVLVSNAAAKAKSQPRPLVVPSGPRPVYTTTTTPSPGSNAPIVHRSTTAANVSIVKAPATTYDSTACPECGPDAEVIVDPHQGVEVCTNCGLQLGAYISDECEWRTFSDRRGADPNRVGGPEIGLFADAGLATMMGDSPNGLGARLARLQNKSAMSSQHRALLGAVRRSHRIASLLCLPRSITDRANELYKTIIESKAMRQRGDSDALITTCVFMVCKSDRVPRTLGEMCGVSEVTPSALVKTFKEIKRLGLHRTLRAPSNLNRANSVAAASGDDDDADADADYKSYVGRWGDRLRLKPRLIEAATTIAVRARATLHRVRDPSTACGAAMYIASYFGDLEDQRKLATVAAVVSMSTPTLRDMVQEIMQNKKAILPPEYISRIVVVE